MEGTVNVPDVPGGTGTNNGNGSLQPQCFFCCTNVTTPSPLENNFVEFLQTLTWITSVQYSCKADDLVGLVDTFCPSCTFLVETIFNSYHSIHTSLEGVQAKILEAENESRSPLAPLRTILLQELKKFPPSSSSGNNEEPLENAEDAGTEVSFQNGSNEEDGFYSSAGPEVLDIQPLDLDIDIGIKPPEKTAEKKSFDVTESASDVKKVVRSRIRKRPVSTLIKNEARKRSKPSKKRGNEKGKGHLNEDTKPSRSKPVSSNVPSISDINTTRTMLSSTPGRRGRKPGNPARMECIEMTDGSFKYRGITMLPVNPELTKLPFTVVGRLVKYVCKDCDFVAKGKYLAKNHVDAVHMGEKKGAGERTLSWQRKITENNPAGNSKPTLSCPHCSEEYRFAKDLLEHMKIHQ